MVLLIKWTVKDLTFMMVCQQVKDMLKSNAVPIVLNIGDEEILKVLVDLVKNRAIVWHDETQGSNFRCY